MTSFKFFSFLGIFLCFISFTFSCSDEIQQTVGCEDLPKNERTSVHFNEPVAQIMCSADISFKDEKNNQIYASFFEKPFLVYKVKDIIKAQFTQPKMLKSVTITRNDGGLGTYFIDFENDIKKPLYYIKFFSSYSPYYLLNYLKEDNYENVFHSLYYESRDEPTKIEVEEKINNKILPEFHRDYGEVSYKEIFYEKKYSSNPLVIAYNSSNDGGVYESMGAFYAGFFTPRFKAKFDSQNNIDYIHISFVKNISMLFPPYRKIKTLQISKCVLEAPAPSVDKCVIVKKMIKEMLCRTEDFNDPTCNKEKVFLPAPTSF